MLAIFYACRNARPEDLERLSVWCVFNPDEELGSRASKEWLRELSTHAKAALVFEAARAGGELVRSRKGSSNIRFTFKGLTAHAGNNPQDGRNANVAAMRLALAAYELDDKTRGTTVNPGLIHGGTGANIISDHAEVTLDLRFWNDEDGRELISKIRALAEKTWVEGVTQTVEARQGVALNALIEIKPRVMLRPFRTFLEVEQPESEFLLRVDPDEGIGFFEADGGIWKLEAKKNIADYFLKNMGDLIDAGKVVVMQ